jgi:ATP-dependent RNA helicase DeaD
MTTDFSSLNLRDEIMQAITELGYSEPTPIQAGMIPLMLTGVDVIGQAQTGTGKTAAFALPILNNFEKQKNPQALVLAPTRELALQVADSMIQYGKHLNVRVLAVYGGQPYSPQINSLKRGVDVVVGTPGRLNDLLERNVLNLSEIKTVVLDEADEMLNMGFIDEVEKILATTPAERQTSLFSATMPARIRTLAIASCGTLNLLLLKEALSPPRTLNNAITLSTTVTRSTPSHVSSRSNPFTAP